MSDSDQKDDTVFEKYYPQHPLPNEIKKMPSKETICQFCGISYLIHSEIKRLEEEIILLNKKINNFDEIQISERKFEKQFRDLSMEIKQLQMKYCDLDERYIDAKTERDVYQGQCMDKDDKILRLESSLAIFKAERDKFVHSQNLLTRQLYALQGSHHSFSDQFSAHKKEILALFLNSQGDISVMSSKVKTTVDKIQDSCAMRCERYQNEINQLSLEVTAAQRKIEEKESFISEEVSRFKVLTEKNNSLIQENSLQEYKLTDYVTQVAQKDDIILMLRNEIGLLTSSRNERINEVNLEVDEMRKENQRLKHSLEEMVRSQAAMDSHLRERDSVIQRLTDSLKGSDLQILEYKNCLRASEEKVSAGCRKIDAMNKERDEQKLENEIELSRMKQELKSKEANTEVLRQEVEDSYRRNLSKRDDDILQLKSSLEMLQRKCSEETLEKERWHDMLKSLERENQLILQKSSELQKHIDSEKRMISRKSEEEEKTKEAMEIEIIEKENIIDKMEEDLIMKNNEIVGLKQMVQQECEERFELTEALNQARQQLLLMGDYPVPKPPSSLPPINHVKSNSSSASDRHSSSTTISNEKRKSVIPSGVGSKNSIISTKRKLERLFNA